MKKLLAILYLAGIYSIGLMTVTSVAHAETEKKVCHDKVDKAGAPVKNKDGTVKQDCKTIKVHKKLEGTAVPEKK